MLNLTLDELKAAFENLLSSPPVPGLVRDQDTGSIGEVTGDLGLVLNEHGEENQRLLVKVTEPERHHKKGDEVIWRDPLSLEAY